MTHCNPATATPDGLAGAVCWSSETLAAIGVLSLLIMMVYYGRKRREQ